MTSKIVVNNIEADAGISTVTFGSEISASTFNGNIVGTSATFSGNVNVAGVLTYEDVTSVDAVGLSTFQNGIHVTGGSVGIGTDNPGAKLDLGGSSSGQTLLFSNTGSNSGSRVASTISFKTGTLYTGKIIESNITGAADDVYDMRFFTANGTASVERLRITGIGSVGIGTDNPDGKLHISSGTSGDCRVYIEADTDNNAEGDNPYIVFKNDGGVENASVWCGNAVGGTNDNSLNLSASTSVGGGIRFFTGNTDGGWETASERLRITSSGNIGIGTDAATNKVSILVPDETSLGSNSEGIKVWDATKQLQLSRTGSSYNYGGVTGTGSLIYSYDKLSLHADTNNAITFATGGFERLSILSNGTIRKGASNSSIGSQPVELFFQKRSTQIGRRIFQGGTATATTHDILNIDSWQSPNSHAFIYVTVYYVSPVANYGGRMECYAHAVNSGGSVSGGQGTFVTSDAGRWGNPGTPSLSWNGSTLQFTTLAHAYIDYSLDITCIAYDGAVVSFYSN